MKNPRIILNELKWKNGHDLDLAEVWYIHRGVPDDTKIISGDKIVKLGRSFMETSFAMIPYHRIFKIIYNKKIIFKR